MKFLDLTIENFMTYQSHQSLPLADQGLVLVRGENRSSACTDSNGVGKTGIFDALTFALFGQTLRGAKADDVACRFTTNQCWTALILEAEGKRWAIERYRRPAGLDFYNVDGKAGSGISGNEAQWKIDDVLGFGARTFRNAVIFGQSTFERFAKASLPDQMKMLDEIQNIDFREAKKRAQDWYGKAMRRKEEICADMRNLNARREAAEGQIEELVKMRDDWAAGQRLAIREGKELVAGYQEELKKEEELLGKIISQNETIGMMKLEKKKIDKLTSELETKEKALREVLEDRKLVYAILEDLNGRMRKALKESRCPTCRVEMTEALKKQVKTNFMPEIVNRKEQADGFDVQAADIEASRDELMKSLDREVTIFCHDFKVQSVGAVGALELHASDSAVTFQRKAYDNALRNIAAANATVKREKERKFSDAPLKVAERECREVLATLAKLEEEIEKVDDAIYVAEYWVEAFGDRGIRSLMFDSVSDFLNGRVAKHLEVLTGGEASVIFSALSSLKGGGTKEKLSVEASWDWGAGTYSTGSAGQDRRVDLAIFGAMQDLAERRSARSFPLRVWDEAGDSLDSRGKEVFAEWIREEARRRGSGFVISHDREFGEIVEPDRIWTVIFEQGQGSKVVIE